jgi:hypothetical protein
MWDCGFSSVDLQLFVNIQTTWAELFAGVDILYSYCRIMSRMVDEHTAWLMPPALSEDFDILRLALGAAGRTNDTGLVQFVLQDPGTGLFLCCRRTKHCHISCSYMLQR